MRRLLTAAVLATGLALTLTACSSSTTVDPAPPAALDPVALVSKSGDAINSTPSHESVTVETSLGSLSFAGDSDPANKVIQVKVTGVADTELRAIGNDLWVQAAGLPKPWVHVDLTKLPEGSSARDALDLKSNVAILAGVTAAREVSPGHFDATSDLARAKAAMSSRAQQNAVQELIDLAGDKAGAIAIKATLDDQHRLLELTYAITSPSSGATSSSRIVVSDYGKPFTATRPPAGDVAEATEEMYSLF